MGSFALTVGGALLAGFLIARFAPEAAGSGIPQLKRAFWQDFGYVPLRIVWVKFIAATLQIGGGSSLGREGPSVQLAGTAGSNLALAAGGAKQK
jgi:CIC family chloride channel protein